MSKDEILKEIATVAKGEGSLDEKLDEIAKKSGLTRTEIDQIVEEEKKKLREEKLKELQEKRKSASPYSGPIGGPRSPDLSAVKGPEEEKLTRAEVDRLIEEEKKKLAAQRGSRGRAMDADSVVNVGEKSGTMYAGTGQTTQPLAPPPSAGGGGGDGKPAGGMGRGMGMMPMGAMGAMGGAGAGGQGGQGDQGKFEARPDHSFQEVVEEKRDGAVEGGVIRPGSKVVADELVDPFAGTVQDESLESARRDTSVRQGEFSFNFGPHGS